MTEKKKGLILAGLLATAGIVFYIDRNGPTMGDPRYSPDRPYTPLQVESLTLRVDKLDHSRRTEYKSSGRDLFTEAPMPVARETARAAQPTPTRQGPEPPPPPEMPKLPANMKYYGYGTVPNGTSKRAFLTDGEDVIIVGEGDTLLGKYRILRIGNANLEFEELTSGMRGTAPLEEQAAPPA